MRHISIDSMYLPEEWDDHATELLDKLRKMTSTDRSKALQEDTDYQIWSLLRPILRAISHGKCFYTEANVVGSGEIDHFRPKSSVQKCDLVKNKSHEGYWWQSLLVKNFRLCVDIANKRRRNGVGGKIYGKGTRFPLSDKNLRAEKETDDLSREQPMLLDPTNPNDVKLLRFDHKGAPISINSDPKSLEFLRVQLSIECYNLVEPAISYKRGTLCTTANDMAVRIIDLEKKKKNGEPYNKREMIEKKALLYEMVQPQAEFSSAIRCVLLPYKFSPSIKRILGL
jgi:hypothetical protein